MVVKRSPSPAQTRALQLLREGKLVWRAASSGMFDISIEPASAWAVHPATAKILVENRWVEMKKFSARSGTYALTTKGKELTNEMCACKPSPRPSPRGRGSQQDAGEFVLLSGISPDATTKKHDWANERLLCRKCWRVVPCAGKFFKQPHPAQRWHGGLGPVCQKHYES
jgi:hypothetical protein